MANEIKKPKLIELVNDPDYFYALVFKAGELVHSPTERERFIKTVAKHNLYLAASCKAAYVQPEQELCRFIKEKAVETIKNEADNYETIAKALAAIAKLNDTDLLKEQLTLLGLEKATKVLNSSFLMHSVILDAYKTVFNI